MRTLRFLTVAACATVLLSPVSAQAGTLDQSQELTNEPIEFGGNFPPLAVAQVFTVGRTGRLDQVQLHLDDSGGAEISVEIRGVDADMPAGPALANGVVRPSSAAWYSVALDSAPAVVAGRQYSIVVHEPATGRLNAHAGSTNPYVPGDLWLLNPHDATWSRLGFGEFDLSFRTFVATPNAAPVAGDDGFTHFGSDTPLVVAAPGVLGNDTDANNDTLSASLVSGPANGTLTLNSDGSLRYLPREDFVGTDSFTYKASDGIADSNAATVRITVGAGCNGRKATHVGTARADQIIGTNGNDVIAGLGGDDRLFGKGGDDHLCGGSGHDRLRGDGGTDSLDGGTQGADWLDGGTGNDRLEGDGGADILFGGPGSDELDGGDGIDQCERSTGDKKRDKCEGTAAQPIP